MVISTVQESVLAAAVRHRQVSHDLTVRKRPRAIVVEDLGVQEMMQNKHLAKAIANAAPYELRRQIQYKAGWTGVEVVVAPEEFASTNTCSQRGAKRDMKLWQRTYRCEQCGLEMDRDLNAAKSLAALAE